MSRWQYHKEKHDLKTDKSGVEMAVSYCSITLSEFVDFILKKSK